MVSRARQLAARGDVRRSRALLEPLVRDEPRNTRAWLALAKVAGRGRGEDGVAVARSVFEEAVEINPRCGHLLHAWAGLEERNGNAGRAAMLLQRCVEVCPGDGVAWQSLALLEERAGRVDEARRVFEEGAGKAEGCASLWSAWGVLEQREGRWDEACELFEKALALNPRHVRAVQAWAIAEEKRGNIGEADALFRRALAIDPKSAPTFQAYALMEARRGHLDTARKLFREGIRIDGKHAAILHAWATMEAKAGNFDEARAVFERGVDAAPDSAPMLRAWAAMELELGHIDDSSDWAVPRHKRARTAGTSGALVGDEGGHSVSGETGRGAKGKGPSIPKADAPLPHSGMATGVSSGKMRKKQMSAVSEKLQLLRRLIVTRTDEDLRVVMQWIEKRAKEDYDLKDRLSVRGQSGTRKVVEWAEKRGEADIAAFREFVEEWYERDRRIGVYVLNFNIPPLGKKALPVPTKEEPSPPPIPQEWFMLADPPAPTLQEFDAQLYMAESPWYAGNVERIQSIEAIEFFGQVGGRLAERSAMALALCSMTLALVGMFVYLDVSGYSLSTVDTAEQAITLTPPSGVDASLIEYLF